MPKTNYEALVLALRLAIDAPTEGKKEECVSIANDLAAQLSEFEVERAKREAEGS